MRSGNDHKDRKELNKSEYRIGVLNGNIAGPLVEKHLPDLSQKVHGFYRASL